jgi:hypothetical protein
MVALRWEVDGLLKKLRCSISPLSHVGIHHLAGWVSGYRQIWRLYFMMDFHCIRKIP